MRGLVGQALKVGKRPAPAKLVGWATGGYSSAFTLPAGVRPGDLAVILSAYQSAQTVPGWSCMSIRAQSGNDCLIRWKQITTLDIMQGPAGGRFEPLAGAWSPSILLIYRGATSIQHVGGRTIGGTNPAPATLNPPSAMGVGHFAFSWKMQSGGFMAEASGFTKVWDGTDTGTTYISRAALYLLDGTRLPDPVFFPSVWGDAETWMCFELLSEPLKLAQRPRSDANNIQGAYYGFYQTNASSGESAFDGAEDGAACYPKQYYYPDVGWINYLPQLVKYNRGGRDYLTQWGITAGGALQGSLYASPDTLTGSDGSWVLLDYNRPFFPGKTMYTIPPHLVGPYKAYKFAATHIADGTFPPIYEVLLPYVTEDPKA